MADFSKMHKHSEPLLQQLMSAFPAAFTPSYQAVHGDTGSTEDENTLKEVVQFFLTEGLVRPSQTQAAGLVLTAKAFDLVGCGLNDILKPKRLAKTTRYG
ncbi:hypothetical protein ACFOEE_08785 [Pseudoalteromonas fenneropenaei]|uniref:Uncharacterized protein n=1 Tax=Pseudoalteromonas fenneropenaei TaxID=1737459 RepID=A0ABV7CJ73_9GAMM